MKKILFISILVFSALTLVGCTALDDNTELVKNDESIEITESVSESIELYDDSKEDNVFGSVGALSDDEFTIEEMLIYAIQDEFAAKAEYTYIINTFDVTKPFTNIIKSEDTHISLLLPLFENYSIDVPIDDSNEHLITISSIQEAFLTGVVAEEFNIAMYELFLSQTGLPDDIYDTFVKLRDASISHLGAFQKNLDTYQ